MMVEVQHTQLDPSTSSNILLASCEDGAKCPSSKDMLPHNADQGKKSRATRCVDLMQCRFYPLRYKAPNYPWKTDSKPGAEFEFQKHQGYGMVVDDPIAAIDFDDDKSRKAVDDDGRQLYPEGCFAYFCRLDGLSPEDVIKATGVVKTPHGYHVLVQHDPKITEGQDFLRRDGAKSYVDVRAQGKGCIVGPGATILADGKGPEPLDTRLYYRPLFDMRAVPVCSLQELLPSLYEVLTTQKEMRLEASRSARSAAAQSKPFDFTGSPCMQQEGGCSDAYFEAVLSANCEKARDQSDGRHQRINDAAFAVGQTLDGRQDRYEVAYARLVEAGIASGRNEKQPGDVEKSVREGLEDGAQHPFTPAPRSITDIAPVNTWAAPRPVVPDAPEPEAERDYTKPKLQDSRRPASDDQTLLKDAELVPELPPFEVPDRATVAEAIAGYLLTGSRNFRLFELDGQQTWFVRSATSGLWHQGKGDMMKVVMEICHRRLKQKKATRTGEITTPLQMDLDKLVEAIGLYAGRLGAAWSPLAFPKLYHFRNEFEDAELKRKAVQDGPWYHVKTGKLWSFKTGEVIDCPPEYFAMKTELAAVPKAGKTPHFDRYLEGIGMVGEKRTRFLQAQGALVFGKGHHYRRVPLFLGEGGAGKTTMLRLLHEMLGGDQGCALMGFDLEREEKSQFYKSEVAQYRVLLIDEKQADIRRHEDDFKDRATGEERKVTYEEKNKKPYQITTTEVWGVACNKLPALKDEGGSARRRWLPVLFDRKPAKPDAFILEKMIPEIPAILQLIVDAMKGIEGPTDFPTIAEDADFLTEVAEVGDPVRRFLGQRWEAGDDSDREKFADVKRDYERWCKSEHRPDHDGPKAIERKLEAAMKDLFGVVPYVGHAKQKWIRGIKKRADADEFDAEGRVVARSEPPKLETYTAPALARDVQEQVETEPPPVAQEEPHPGGLGVDHIELPDEPTEANRAVFKWFERGAQQLELASDLPPRSFAKSWPKVLETLGLLLTVLDKATGDQATIEAMKAQLKRLKSEARRKSAAGDLDLVSHMEGR